MQKFYFLAENEGNCLLACKAKGIKTKSKKEKSSLGTAPQFVIFFSLKDRDKGSVYHRGRRERATAQHVKPAGPHHHSQCTTFHKLHSQTFIFKHTQTHSSGLRQKDYKGGSSKPKTKINISLTSNLSLISVHCISSPQTPILNLHCCTESRGVSPFDSIQDKELSK